MVVILKGSPFQGTVSLSAHGPFHTEEEAVTWAVHEWEAEPEWYVLEVHHPGDYNESNPEDEEGEIIELGPGELDRMLAQADARKKNNMAPEVMLDLSGIVGD